MASALNHLLGGIGCWRKVVTIMKSDDSEGWRRKNSCLFVGVLSLCSDTARRHNYSLFTYWCAIRRVDISHQKSIIFRGQPVSPSLKGGHKWWKRDENQCRNQPQEFPPSSLFQPMTWMFSESSHQMSDKTEIRDGFHFLVSSSNWQAGVWAVDVDVLLESADKFVCSHLQNNMKHWSALGCRPNFLCFKCSHGHVHVKWTGGGGCSNIHCVLT